MVLPLLNEENKKGLVDNIKTNQGQQSAPVMIVDAQTLPAIMQATGNGPTETNKGTRMLADALNISNNQQGSAPNMGLTQHTPMPVNQKEQDLRDAELELQEAKEEDSLSGSEGYEKKEDGIFARMANWGSSVGDYLFGADTPEEVAAKKAEEERIAAEKADKGVIGYYADKWFGETSPEEEAKIAEEKRQKGLLGYYSQKANGLMEDMARSPYSKFVDPTTVLGGQQTMVKNLDAYHSNRGIPGLRKELLEMDKELLEMDKARLGTTIGQAQEYARIMNDPNVSEEQKAAITQYMQNRSRAADGSLGYAKTQEQAYLRDLADFESQTGRRATRDEQIKMAQYHGAASPEEIFNKPQIVKTAEQAAIARKLQAEKDLGRPLTPEELDEIDKYYGTGRHAISKQYTPPSIEGAAQKAQVEKTQSGFGEEINSTIQRTGQAITNKANAEAALKLLEAHPEYAGEGDFGKALRRFGETYGIAEGSYEKLEYLINQIKGGQIAEIIENQNSGHVSDSERADFNRQTVDLGRDPESVKAGLRLYILSNDLVVDSADFLTEQQANGVHGPSLQRAYYQYRMSRAPETSQKISDIVGATKYVTGIDKATGKKVKLRRKQ